VNEHAAKVRVVALGNAHASDDGAALEAARRLRAEDSVEVVLAGRPGAGLLELLEPRLPTVLLDVVRLGAYAGSIIELPLDQVADASIDGHPLSSHGFGVGQALRLARELGRALPRGVFVGIGGARFEPGDARSAEVEARIDALVAAAQGAIDELRRSGACMSTG
jgi:hydrogenase maturation protease